MSEVSNPPNATAPRAKVNLKSSRLSKLQGFRLRLAQVGLVRDYMASVEGLNLTPRQYTVLELIDENPGVSQADLAATLTVDRATMMALIDRLEARALLVRRVSQSDRRRQDLSLTADGIELLGRAHRVIADHEARILNDWTPPLNISGRHRDATQPPEELRQRVSLGGKRLGRIGLKISA